MFENLTKRLSNVFKSLTQRGALSEKDLDLALREIRIALLEADVSLPVVKDFITKIKESALGKEVIKSVTPGQMVVKIVHEQLVQILGEGAEINLKANPPVVIMLVGLQGSGKTTHSAKIALHLSSKRNKKVLLASLDVYRPAAQLQLEQLAEKIRVDSLSIEPKENPLQITKRALDAGKNYDCIILDTAGRLHIDQELMEELQQIKSLSKPLEILLVADSMTGQDAVKIASHFHEALQTTGLILTRVDGDARGGAVLSMREVTKQPVKFLGTGEKLEALEIFDPKRIADRILDMGDIVSFVEQAAQNISEEDQEKIAKRMMKGSFGLTDMLWQLQNMQKMGGLNSIMSMLPGMQGLQDKLKNAKIQPKIIERQIAIIRSMTKQELRNEGLLNASRKRRIAKGAGVEVQDVNKLLKQFGETQRMMKTLFKGKGKLSMLKNLFKG